MIWSIIYGTIGMPAACGSWNYPVVDFEDDAELFDETGLYEVDDNDPAGGGVRSTARVRSHRSRNTSPPLAATPPAATEPVTKSNIELGDPLPSMRSTEGGDVGAMVSLERVRSESLGSAANKVEAQVVRRPPSWVARRRRSRWQ